MAVKDETGKALCYYEPGEFQVVADEESGLLHVHKLGEWDLARSQEIEPEEMEEDSRFAGSMKTHDLNTNMPAALRAMNERNRAYWADRKAPTSSSAALDYGKSPHQQMAGLKALNALHRRRFGRGG
jgi:hypothetical protein